MKASAITLLIVAGIVLVAPPQAAAQTTYVEIDAVFVIYRNFYYSDAIKLEMTDAEVDVVKGEIDDAVNFFWRGSNLKCHINVIETLVIDRQLTLDQLIGYGGTPPTTYMLEWLSVDGGVNSVENDLNVAGYFDSNGPTLVVALWALQDNGADPVINERFGGQEWGPDVADAVLGDSIFISIPMSKALVIQVLVNSRSITPLLMKWSMGSTSCSRRSTAT